MPYLHVTSARNRSSITEYGLDWTRMGAARGIAGSRRPETDGIFLCRNPEESEYFLGFDNGDGPFDVWSVEGVAAEELLDDGSGYDYVPRPIPPRDLALVEQDHPGGSMFSNSAQESNSTAYSSRLTLVLDDGTVLTGDDAAAVVRDAADSKRASQTD